MQPQQHMPYTTMAAQAHQNNMGHNSNSFRSFGEVNGHQVQQTDQSPQIYTVTMAPVRLRAVFTYLRMTDRLSLGCILECRCL